MEGQASRFRYGGTECWVLRKNLVGTRARRLMDMVELHFQEEGSPLVLDLREVPVVDSEGACFLEAASLRHAGLRLLGRPRDFDTLPPRIRRIIDILRPSENLEQALARQAGAVIRGTWPDKRRHFRVPVQIPVEIIMGGRATVATLRDISLGGGRFGRVSPRLAGTLAEGNGSLEMTLSGMDSDPLGREIAASHLLGEVVTRPVYILPDNSGMGVQFTPGSPDPPPT
jgi:anti-anti-sigma regulatory factor